MVKYYSCDKHCPYTLNVDDQRRAIEIGNYVTCKIEKDCVYAQKCFLKIVGEAKKKSLVDLLIREYNKWKKSLK